MDCVVEVDTEKLGEGAERVNSCIKAMIQEIEGMTQSIGRIRWDGDGQDGGPVKKAFEKDLNAIWVAVRKLERIYRYAVNAKEKYEGCEQSVRALISTMH